MTTTITVLLLRRRSFTHSLRRRACRMADNNGDDDGDDFQNHAADKDAGSLKKMPGQQPRSFPAIRYHDPTFTKPPTLPTHRCGPPGPHWQPGRQQRSTWSTLAARATAAIHMVHTGSQGDSSGPHGPHWQPGRQQRSTWSTLAARATAAVHLAPSIHRAEGIPILLSERPQYKNVLTGPNWRRVAKRLPCRRKRPSRKELRRRQWRLAQRQGRLSGSHHIHRYTIHTSSGQQLSHLTSIQTVDRGGGGGEGAEGEGGGAEGEGGGGGRETTWGRSV